MKLTIALDWKPNAIHAGIYLAKQKGWYNEHQLEIELLSPERNNYDVTPIQSIQNNEVQFAIAPSESLIRAHEQGHVDLIAIATLLQGSPSAFGMLKKSTKESSPNLKDKKYAALELPYEKIILQEFSKQSIEFIIPNKLEIYEILFEGKADLVWLFKNIEEVEAKQRGIDIVTFSLEEAGIPYGPCTTLISHQDFLSKNPTEARNFLAITEKGYQEIVNNTTASIDFLTNQKDSFCTDKKLLAETIKASIPYYLNQENRWGIMNPLQWKNFVEWLKSKNQFTGLSPELTKLYTNSILENSLS